MDRSCKVAKVDACNIRNSCYKTVRKFAKKPILCCLFCGQVFESFRSKNTRVKRCCVLSPILCLINTTRKISFRKKRKPMLKKNQFKNGLHAGFYAFPYLFLYLIPNFQFSIFSIFLISSFVDIISFIYFSMVFCLMKKKQKSKKQLCIDLCRDVKLKQFFEFWSFLSIWLTLYRIYFLKRS